MAAHVESKEVAYLFVATAIYFLQVRIIDGPVYTHYLRHIKSDLPAGFVMFLVALPLCLGIALASGAPMFAGLVSGIVGGLVVSWLSGWQLSVSGPAAGLTVIVFNGIQTLGSFQGFLVALILSGIIQNDFLEHDLTQGEVSYEFLESGIF